MPRSQIARQERQGTDSSGRRKPFVLTLPTRTGDTTGTGDVQTGTNGTFGGSGTVTVTREWWRGGVQISGQTGATYTTQAADQGKQLRFVNRAKNQYGEIVASSVPVTIT